MCTLGKSTASAYKQPYVIASRQVFGSFPLDGSIQVFYALLHQLGFHTESSILPNLVMCQHEFCGKKFSLHRV